MWLKSATGENYFFINPVTGVKMPSGDPIRADYKTKAQVVEYVKKSFADDAALIKSKGDGGIHLPGIAPEKVTHSLVR